MITVTCDQCGEQIEYGTEVRVSQPCVDRDGEHEHGWDAELCGVTCLGEWAIAFALDSTT